MERGGGRQREIIIQRNVSDRLKCWNILDGKKQNGNKSTFRYLRYRIEYIIHPQKNDTYRKNSFCIIFH